MLAFLCGSCLMLLTLLNERKFVLLFCVIIGLYFGKLGEGMDGNVRVFRSALKHGISKEDIDCAWRNAIIVRRRNFDVPCIYAAAGPDRSGNLVELLLAEQEDGSFLAYHAMGLTRKMADELNL